MTATASSPGSRPAPAGQIAVGLARSWLRRYAMGCVVWGSWWLLPAGVGLLLQAAFDSLSGERSVGWDLWTLLAALAAVEGARLVLFFVAFPLWARWWGRGQALLRTNLLHAQVASGGRDAGTPVRDSGAAIASFRNDVDDVVEYTDGWLDLGATLLFGVVALVVMARVDVVLTLVVALPLAVVFIATRVLAERIRRVRAADRAATARVTGFLGDVCAAVLALKVAGAEDRAIGRLRELNGRRRRTAQRDRVLQQAFDSASLSAVDVTIGLVLLLSAAQMRAGTFTVGDLALFASYLAWLAWVPHWAATMLTRHRQVQVAGGRMAGLLPRADARAVVTSRPLDLRAGAPLPQQPVPPTPPAPHLRLRGFTARHADGRGVEGVDLDLPPGSFTVVTGAVGAGKSTLLRGLLGLTDGVEGVVTWDGERVLDLAAWFVPPRAAYVPQVPRLVSATLHDNLVLGRAVDSAVLEEAVRTAALDRDVAAMGGGLGTRLGPRGVRLSGGQLQRAATARALAAAPALLVLDDLSSALDARTERQLWSRLLDDRPGGPPTVLVVSHRAAALARADQVVRLDGGHVVDVELRRTPAPAG